MGGSCGTYGGRERYAQNVGGETRGKETIGGDQDVDGMIILIWIFRKWVGVCGEWMELAEDRDRRLGVQCWNFGLFHKMPGIS
jgi:hypothetical protein